MVLLVEKIYADALDNAEFDEDMRRQDPIGYYRPDAFSSDLAKGAYAIAYYGWMLGKGTYNRKKYE